METAKVDIRKLQLLNDRINQCLDALTQVRLSVHGLSHSASTSAPIASVQSLPAMGYAGAVGFPAVQDPRLALGATPFGGGYPGGLSHSAFVPQAAQQMPIGFPATGLPAWNPVSSLSHSGAEIEAAYGFQRPLWADPILAARVVQTFPYAQLAVPASPIAAIY